MTPLLMLGAGRMGGALIEGWRAAEAVSPRDLIIRDPHPGEAADAAAKLGARLNPPDPQLAEARTVLVCVKPQIWREAAVQVEPLLAPDAVVVSIAAGVKAADLAAAFGGRRVARVMPTTAVAIRQGVASIFAEDAEARRRAHALFAPVAQVVDLADEELMHAATAVSGSSPAYLYAFIEALEAAGLETGLDAAASRTLARVTITGAAALLAQSGENPAELRRQVTSPGGTTEAALKVLTSAEGFASLLSKAVAAAAQRSRELGA
jgi:pyrroline-5-carboxylate reductase